MSSDDKAWLGVGIVFVVLLLLVVGILVWSKENARDDRRWRYEVCLTSDRSVQECQDKLFND